MFLSLMALHCQRSSTIAGCLNLIRIPTQICSKLCREKDWEPEGAATVSHRILHQKVIIMEINSPLFAKCLFNTSNVSIFLYSVSWQKDAWLTNSTMQLTSVVKVAINTFKAFSDGHSPTATTEPKGSSFICFLE